jgi:hypothetical protein
MEFNSVLDLEEKEMNRTGKFQLRSEMAFVLGAW